MPRARKTSSPSTRAPSGKSLDRYVSKRTLTRTPEPGPDVPTGRHGPLMFVIQKHAARRLHYDFRLECDGVLKSWAVPKGPSLTLGDKRMAIEVEDQRRALRLLEAALARHGSLPPGPAGQDAARDAFVRSLAMLRAEADALRRALGD